MKTTHAAAVAVVILSAALGSAALADIKVVDVHVTADSEAPGYEAYKALDGDPSTMWHTLFGPTDPPLPHEMTVDLRAVYEITGIAYLPRSGGGNGTIEQYEIYVSADGREYGAALAAGSFTTEDNWNRVAFSAPTRARYIKLRALSEIHGRPWTSIAELKIRSAGVEFRASPRSWFTMPGTDRLAETESERQYVTLLYDLKHRARTAAVADQAFRPEALILDSDRDPADIVLRRTAALLARIEQLSSLGEPRVGVHRDRAASQAGSVARLAELAEELVALQAEETKIPVENTQARYALYERACQLRRRIAFANPLLDFDQIVFLKRHRALFNHMCDQYYGMAAAPGGGLYILEDAFGPRPRVRNVLADAVVQNGRLQGQKLCGGTTTPPPLRFDGEGNLEGPDHQGGSFLSPDLSYDGQRILFAYVEGRGDKRHRHHTDPTRGHWDEGRCYHIFQVNVDGSHLIQLTDGTWNDFDPCWLPNGRIAFISERRGGYLRCGRTCPTYTLFDMAADGSDIRCLSFHETNEWNPSVTNDGRIIWTRWDYVDRHGCTAHMPWLTTLDGCDPRPVHGNYAPRNLRPDMELNVRAIPGSHRFVATAAPHHGQAFGSLVVIDPHVPDDDAMAPVKRLTPEVGFPESQGGAQVYGTAWPLSEDFYLCAYDPGMQADVGFQGGQLLRGDYGVYLIDSFGNKELIYRDSEIAAMNPIPLRPRPRPATPASMARYDDALESNPATRHSVPTEQPADEATVVVMNVHASRYAWPADAQIKALRVVQILPMSVPSGAPPHETGVRLPEAGDSVVPTRAVLGTVPVEEDGSAQFIVPAYKEIFFQALDERGRAVLSMRSATQARAGEHLVCAGCHAGPHQTPAVPDHVPLALTRPPSRLEPDVEGSNPFSYPRLVQPVLERHCVACHASHPGGAPNLGIEPIQRKWYASYQSLLPFAFTTYSHAYRTTPAQFGARAAKLTELLDNGHYDVQLSDEEMHRITLWLDCLSMFYGVYENEGGQAQLQGQIVRPTLE